MEPDENPASWKDDWHHAWEEHRQRTLDDPEFAAEWKRKSLKKRKALEELIKLEEELGLDD